ncbi:MAG: DUF4178 domain-containing protein [Saccharofermentans sp.]|nr:DUF4178 domain-containing protein [Saccharofermentans sp.]
MKKSTKKTFKIILIILAAIAVAVPAYMGIVWACSDRIVKLSFNGLENMFTVHDEYYAVAGPFRTLVPKAFVQKVCDKDPDNIGETDKEAGRVLNVEVNWSENGRPVFEGTTTLIHSFSNKYVFEVRSPGPEKCVVSRDEERLILDIAKHFHDFEKGYARGEGNWVAYTGGSTTIFSFELYINGDKSLISVHQPGRRYEVYSFDSGKPVKIMKVPEKGHFDVLIWKNR